MNLRKFENISFNQIPISGRDIYKTTEYYMEKEISESHDIVKKTIDNLYIKNNFSKSFHNFTKNFHSLIKKKKIKNIIFTGMGTTFTAAQVISYFFSSKLKEKYEWLNIRSVLASEGSLRNLKPDMSDTALFVIAQSGTTRDTNVFAELSKQRNCKVISFLNKRNGDIFFIADETFYIGDGRDVEMSVPSTKTYHAHIILGTIFLSALLQKKNEQIESIRKINFYKKISKIFYNQDLNYLYEKFSANKNWYILSDNALNGILSNEARIKFSECCYKSTATMSIQRFEKLEVRNSVVILLCELNKKNNELIKKITNRNNIVLIISNKKFKLEKSKKLFQINLGYNDDLHCIIYKILITQLLSFSLSKYLNHKSNFFKELSELNTNNFKTKKDKIIKKIEIFKSLFLNNFLKKKLILNIKENKILNIKKISLEIHQSLSRTIDTVRHQAKTITVGTNRSNSFKKKNISSHSSKKNAFVGRKLNNKKFLFYFKNVLKNSCNFKILYDLKNYHNSILLSEFFAKEKNITFALDNIENHKHVDISSEPLIIVLLSSNNSDDFVLDSISEFESMMSHKNKVFVIMDKIDKRYLKVFKKEYILVKDNTFFNEFSLKKFF